MNIKRVKKFVYWLPRVLGILFLIFISIFSIDVFFEGYGFWIMLWAFFMHLIPSILLLIALLVAWKWERVGGILFIILGVVAIIFFRNNRLMSFLIIALPVFVIGILFLLSWKYRCKRRKRYKRR